MRYHFGATASDYAAAVGVGNSLNISPGQAVVFYAAATGGSPVTDILDLAGAAISSYACASDGSMPEFQGPDSVTALWGDVGGPRRVKLVAHLDTVLPSLALGGSGLIPSATKTTSYTAVAGDFIPVDLFAGNAVVALPSAPPDKTQVGIVVQKVSSGVVGAYTVTINRGGIDTFDDSSGSTTSIVMGRLGHSRVLQYQASTKIWFTVGGHVDPGSLQTTYDSRYALAGATDRYLAAGSSGDDVYAGMAVLTEDIYVPANMPITDALVAHELPNFASGSIVYRLTDWNAGSETVIGTLTIPALGTAASSTANTRAARLSFTSGSSYTINAGHYLRCYAYQANGSGYWGRGPALHLLMTGTFPSLSTGVPSTPGTITTTPALGQVGLSAALSTGAEELLYVDTAGGVTTPVGRTATGGFTHTGLAAGSTHTYQAVALGPWSASAVSTSVTASPTSSYQSFLTDGTFDAAGVWSATYGTSTSPTPNASVVTTTGVHVATFQSGQADTGGTANVQDTIWATFIGETHTHTAWRADDIVVALGDSQDSWELYFSCDAFVSLATTMTHYIQFQMNAVGIRVGYKSGGSFTKLSDTGNSALTFLGTSTDTNGQIHYAATQTTDGAHYYGVAFDALPIDAGTGTQTINIYSGTEAQAGIGLGGSGLTLIATVVVPQTARSAIPAGYCGLHKLGYTNGTSKTTRFKSLQITPTSPNGL